MKNSSISSDTIESPVKIRKQSSKNLGSGLSIDTSSKRKKDSDKSLRFSQHELSLDNQSSSNSPLNSPGVKHKDRSLRMKSPSKNTKSQFKKSQVSIESVSEESSAMTSLSLKTDEDLKVNS